MIYSQKMLKETKKDIDLIEFKNLLEKDERLMGIDLGKKRIGISVSTSNLDGALPLRTIEREKFSDQLIELSQIVLDYRIKGIIFGLPLNMDGSEGRSAQSIKDKSLQIATSLELTYAFWDERLSTVAAERFYENPSKSRQKKRNPKKDIDNLASAFILEGALEYIKRNQLDGKRN